MLGVYRIIKRISKAHHGQIQFYLESDYILNLNHQCIPTVFGREEDEQYIYLLEEYCYGETLQSIIKKKKQVSIDWRIYKVVQLLTVLSDIHGDAYWGILHLDIKPSHLICQEDQIKLIDFGLAVLRNNHEARCLFGTKEYMAPEVAKYGRVSIQADIYSVGRVMENLLYNGETNPQLASRMKKIAKVATNRCPDQRFSSANEFKQAIIMERNRNQRGLPMQKHLRRSILIVGSHKRVGATHIAVGLTCTLNYLGITSYYQTNSSGRWIEQLSQDCRNFIGYQHYGLGVVEPKLPRGICLYDGGNLERFLYLGLEDMQDYELVVLVIGGKIWEQDSEIAAITRVITNRNTRVVCNLADTTNAKIYAKFLGCKVYNYPVDSNPYLVTDAKEKLTRELLDIRR